MLLKCEGFWPRGLLTGTDSNIKTDELTKKWTILSSKWIVVMQYLFLKVHILRQTCKYNYATQMASIRQSFYFLNKNII